jgi:hypothetical protein
VNARISEVGTACGIGGDLGTDALELTSTDVLKILAFRRCSGGLVKVDRYFEALPYLGANVLRHGDAVFDGDALNGDERYDICGAHSGMRPLVLGQVDEFGSLADAADSGFLNGFTFAHESDDTAIMIRVHLAIEEVHAWNLHSLDDGINFRLIAALGEVGNALY